MSSVYKLSFQPCCLFRTDLSFCQILRSLFAKIAVTKTIAPPRINNRLKSRKPIAKPATREPIPAPKGANIVSMAPASSGYSFSFLESRLLRPELAIKSPIDFPIIKAKITAAVIIDILKKTRAFKTIPNSPNKIENTATIKPPFIILLFPSPFLSLLIINRETGRNTKGSKEQNRITWFCSQPISFKNKRKNAR